MAKTRKGGALIAIAGIVVIVLSVFADIFRIGPYHGYGWRQTLGVILGCAAVMIGGFLFLKAGRQRTLPRASKEGEKENEVGFVTHYFNKLQVAAIKLTGEVHIGDTLHIKGHTTDLIQKVHSMQLEHKPIEAGESGQEIAIKVDGQVREHDVVYKVLS